MVKMPTVVIHTNPHLKHQVDFARALRLGFSVYGMDAVITSERTAPGKIHVVLGPWYALRQHAHHRILYLDRCFYGNPRWTVALGWLENGVCDYRNHGMNAPNGSLPSMKRRKGTRHHAVVFGDYNQKPIKTIEAARAKYPKVTYRPHPANEKPTVPLRELWQTADVAIGHSSSVLVEAELNGLHVVSTDPNHVCQAIRNRKQWIINLSWAQWKFQDVKRGKFWSHLKP